MKDQREAFEEWAEAEGFDLDRAADGSGYWSFSTVAAWGAWQAAIASCKRETLTAEQARTITEAAHGITAQEARETRTD